VKSKKIHIGVGSIQLPRKLIKFIGI